MALGGLMEAVEAQALRGHGWASGLACVWNVPCSCSHVVAVVPCNAFRALYGDLQHARKI